MSSNVYIFIGQSGAGKGTQGRLLEQKLKDFDKNSGVLYLETGARFRELIKSENFTARKTKEVMKAGKLPPSFLGIHAWTHFLIEDYDGASHVIIDGTPRVPEEVPIILSAAKFFEWNTHVIFIDVSDEWAHDKMSGRHRADDDERDIWERIQWYHESVEPTIELLRNSPVVTFHCIHGEQTIDLVHRDICFELGLE